MSLLKRVGKFLGKVAPVAAVIPGAGPILGTIGKIAGVVGAAKAAGKQLPLPGIPQIGGGSVALPALGAAGAMALRGAGKVLSSGAARGVGGAIIGGAAAEYVMDKFGNWVPKKKRRKINPCNGRALNRALRRIEQYDKVRKRVDKSLRKACPTPTRRAPSRRCK